MRNTTAYRGLAACAVLLAGAIAASGHGGATGIVGERMMGMMMLGEQLKLLAPIAEHPAPEDMQTLATAAEMIGMHAGRAMTDLFPEGSLDAPSEARPEIWQRWQEFSGHADHLALLGAELGAAANRLGSSDVTAAAAVPPQPLGQMSEWEQMDFAWLIGLSPVRPGSIDPVTTASIASTAETRGQKPMRTVQAIHADIAATCSACHAAFRP